mmetsp:Transcript_13644/g.13212  ORF Transcript_13644/g.13212 Transcript_13644/m.13212 type:complete len:240 (-) Transcript_13644:34-753(-)
MQRALVDKEIRLCQDFARDNVSTFGMDNNKVPWKGLLSSLCGAVFEMVKHNMCTDFSLTMLSVHAVVRDCFSLQYSDLVNCFCRIENGEKLLSSIYYIAGWLLSSMKKAAIRRQEPLRGRMIRLYKTNLISQEKASILLLPSKKVECVQESGGLAFVSLAFYTFSLKLEYIFVKTLQETTLAILGHLIIEEVYTSLRNSQTVRSIVVELLEGDGLSCGINEDNLTEIVSYLVKTWCRMR